MSGSRCTLVVGLAWLCASDAALVDTNHGSVAFRGGRAVEKADDEAHASEDNAFEMDAAMLSMVDRLLSTGAGHFPSRSEMTKVGLRKGNLKAAAKHLEGKLPADVASLVSLGVEGKSSQPFAEESLAKALKVLNELIEKGWKALDEKMIQCKEFEEKNRGTYDQVMTDIARLSSMIAQLQKQRAEAQECIEVKETEIIQTTELLKEETAAYMKQHLENQREMNIRKNDLAVFQFMMVLTKCQKTALVQLGKHATDHRAAICESPQGLLELNFDDKKAQVELERRLTPSARQAIHELLASIQAVPQKKVASLLEKDAKYQPFNKSNTDMAPAPPVTKEKVQKDVTAAGPFKCNKGAIDCGLLHDKMSLMWGSYKDLVDELQQLMDKNEFEFEEIKENLNQQLDIMRNAKTVCITEMNEATANINSANEELAEKESESRELESEYTAYMRACRKRITYILYQDICSYIIVRAQTMSYSKVSPPEKIVDCDVSKWVPDECSVSCDDECPDKLNPYGCGGWQQLNREVIQFPNEFGFKCAALSVKKKCSQIKCPVDCEESKWSTYGKCSKDCEGGVQGRTRSILTVPKNGGMACNTVQEARPCNTGSCDRNCRLKKWSKWSPCSVACSGGFQERWRRVTVPIRGKGRCPKPTSKHRYRMRDCNTHDCTGDEICIAKQDLILAIDGSGSLTASGFKVLKDFAVKLIGNYRGEYFGMEDMQVGVVQFGNGEIMEDGSIAKAKEIIALSTDIAKVKTALEGLEYLKGFTNMAQAYTKAEDMFVLGGRKAAQEAVLTLTDGKPSFLFQTEEKVMQMKDKHIQLFFAPVTEYEGDELNLMKKWASDPWETNIVHIPGLAPLKADAGIFAQKMLVKFCPNAISPSAMMYEEETVGYMLVRENGSCGPTGKLLSKDTNEAADCAALAQGAGVQAFALGIKYARGRCQAKGLEVTKALVDDWEKNRAEPACPAGGWEDDALYDFYIIMPAV